MKRYLRDKLRELKVDYHLVDGLHSLGQFIPENSQMAMPATIFLNADLSEDEQEIVLLHELGHLLTDDTMAEKYHDDYAVRCESEKLANDYMLDKMTSDYADLVEAESANFVNLANYLQQDYDAVAAALKKAYQQGQKQKRKSC